MDSVSAEFLAALESAPAETPETQEVAAWRAHSRIRGCGNHRFSSFTQKVPIIITNDFHNLSGSRQREP